MSSIYNSTTQILPANGQFNGSYEKLNTNIESISLLIKSDVDGQVSIYFANNPSDPVLYTHTYEYDHTQEFHRVVSKKGLYMRVNFINGATEQTSFQLVVYLKTDFEVEQTTEGGNDVNITNEFLSTEVINNITVEGLTFDEAGALIVSGSTITGFATEQTLSEIKTELTTNMPTKTIQENTFDETYLIRVQNTPLQHEDAYADILVDGPTMGADSNPPFTYHPTSEGWYYQNTVAGGASNLYFYANTQTKQTQYTISELMNSYVVVKLANMTATNTLPILAVYSRPTGSGDAVPGFYKSRWVYTIPNTAQLSQIGQEFLLYWGELPSVKIHPNIHRVQATLASSSGPAQQSETLQFLTVNTESSATVNTVKVIYTNCGWTTIGGLVHNTVLGYGKEDKTRQITDKIDNLNSTVGSGVFVQLDGTVSGLKLKSSNNDGSADVKVVNDITIDTTEPLQTVALAKVHNTLNNAFLTVDAEQQLRVAIGSGSTVGITGPVGIAGSVESHCYGSSDGTTWHHLKTNTNGVLSTNAIVETANGTLTSTINDEVNALDVQVQNIVNTNLRTSTGGLLTSTSAGTINSLDVAIKAGSDLRTTDNGALTSTLSGTGNSVHALDVQVKNTSITAIQKSQPASVQTVLTNEICNCTGPADSRALTTSYDTTGFLYVSVVLNITNYSQSGFGSPSIYLQSSPDGVLWFNETSNSVFQNGAMKIQAYNVLTVPYVRLYLDCNSITSPNVIQFTISTALLCQK